MLSTNFYRHPFADQGSSAFFGSKSPLFQRLPLTMDLSFSTGSGGSNRFVDKFSNEITSLTLRESMLAKKLAKAQKKELTREQEEALSYEHAQIESSKKYLNIILSAIQQSMQNITANFR